MAWDDAAEIQKNVDDGLKTFDWTRIEELCQSLIKRVRSETVPFPHKIAEDILRRLRRKRRFSQMASLAEAFAQGGLPTSAIAVWLLYPHSLIELGYLTAAERLLDSVAITSDVVAAEVAGQRGRIAKQRYVNAGRTAASRYPAALDQSIREYMHGYERNQNYWHAINVVALILRAQRDGVRLDDLPDPRALAREIIERLTARHTGTDPMPAFEIASLLEAHLALGEEAMAEETALEYAVNDEADAFQFASTLRQLVEVWEFSDDAPPGSRVLPILRAALLKKEGGGIRMDARKASADLEKVFGRDRFNPLEWYQKGLQRCRSIARIERGSAGYGTGWLFKATDLFEGRAAEELLLITNAHVIASDRSAAMRPEEAVAHFQMSGTRHEIEAIVWSSPVAELDATIVKLKPDPAGAEGLPLSEAPLALEEPPPRLYVIGHPGGRGLEFSLQDNVMLGCSDRRLHYRTPTEGGSSGSPVFEQNDWKIVALHHAGKANMARLDGSGTYEANEGIPISAIRQATRKSAGSTP